MHFIINMSKDKNNNETNEFFNKCEKIACCRKNEIELESKNSLLKYYEEADCKDILTANGRDLADKAKTVLVYMFWVAILLTMLSMKNTLDNINARVHNTPSVTTK